MQVAPIFYPHTANRHQHSYRLQFHKHADSFVPFTSVFYENKEQWTHHQLAANMSRRLTYAFTELTQTANLRMHDNIWIDKLSANIGLSSYINLYQYWHILADKCRL